MFSTRKRSKLHSSRMSLPESMPPQFLRLRTRWFRYESKMWNSSDIWRIQQLNVWTVSVTLESALLSSLRPSSLALVCLLHRSRFCRTSFFFFKVAFVSSPRPRRNEIFFTAGEMRLISSQLIFRSLVEEDLKRGSHR